MRGEGIVPVMEVNGNNGNGCGFGNNGDWAWIIVLFLIFGWGRNGFGGGYGSNGGGSGAYDNYVLASDFSQLSRQISDGFSGVERRTDSIINGLCDGFYTNAQLINGVNTNILTNANTINASIKDCCCTTQRSIDGVNYNLAKGVCDITTNTTMNTRDVIDQMNANFRNLHDEIVANRIEDKNAQITAQQNEINALRLAASQEKQNAYLLSELKTCPKPSYIVPNPNCCYNYQVTQNPCGCNNGCGGF